MSSVYQLRQGAHVGVCLSFSKITQKVMVEFGLNFLDILEICYRIKYYNLGGILHGDPVNRNLVGRNKLVMFHLNIGVKKKLFRSLAHYFRKNARI